MRMIDRPIRPLFPKGYFDEVQIAILTTRITHLTEHLQGHVKDHSSRRGLIKMVGKRNAMLKYLKQTDLGKYHKIIADLGLRK
jgi:small subunit ribosomal protein S15